MVWFWGSGTPWWVWALGCIGMLLLWGGVIWVVWYVVSQATRRDAPEHGRSPERILDERFARGEIGADEYRERRNTIRATTHGETRAPVGVGDRS